MCLQRRLAASLALCGMKPPELSARSKLKISHIYGALRGDVAPSHELLTFLAMRGINTNWLLTGRGLPEVLPDSNGDALGTAFEYGDSVPKTYE